MTPITKVLWLSWSLSTLLLLPLSSFEQMQVPGFIINYKPINGLKLALKVEEFTAERDSRKNLCQFSCSVVV